MSYVIMGGGVEGATSVLSLVEGPGVRFFDSPLPLGEGPGVRFFRTLQTLLIPEATNREPNSLKVDVPVYIAVVAVQVAVPGVWCTVLRRTPPGSIVANAAECSNAATVATRKACKSTAICSACIWT